MSAEQVQADVGIGTVEGTIVDRIPSPEFANISRELVVIEADGSTYRVDAADVE